jgi:hypothetical protein
LCTPESQFKIQLLPKLGLAEPVQTFSYLRAKQILNGNHRFLLWGVDLDEPGDHDQVLSESIRMPELIAEIVRRYGIKVDKSTADFWIDHTPSNTRYGKILATWFPQARFIHIVRDGRAVAASVIPLDFGPDTILDAAYFWIERVSYGLMAELFFGPARAIRVRYEDLLADPSGTLRRLCEWLGIGYEAGMEQRRGFAVPEYTQAQHALVEQSIDVSRTSAWQERLTPRQVEIFEFIVGEMLEYLGYSRVTGFKARKARKIERLKMRLYAFFMRHANKRRYARRKAVHVGQHSDPSRYEGHGS